MLYLHIPYCHHKCTYCAFYSVARGQNIDEYVDALCKELESRSTVGLRRQSCLRTSPLRTVYFGGGTPTVLSISQLKRIVSVIRDNYDVSKIEEVTIEANPENLVPEYLDGLASLNFFNRISIGVQSFDDRELKMLNRVHSGLQACEAIANAAAAGFLNVSVDLMMGLPHPFTNNNSPTTNHQSLITSLATLGKLLSLDVVKHLSCYELSVEKGTMLERQLQMGRLTMPDDDEVASQYDILYNWCQDNGFEQYEVSNFCKPGWHSRHNSRYWDRTPYIGVGAAAHSFDGLRRRWNIADIPAYIEGAYNGRVPYEEEILTEKDAYNEYIMTALRTEKGIDKSLVPDGFMQHLVRQSAKYIEEGLLADDGGFLRPTKRGLLHADGIAAEMFV